MVKPKILKILNQGLVTSVLVSTLSFFIPIVLCSKSPVIAVPDYKFSICKLPNPFAEQLVGISQKFYGVSAEPLAGFILQFLLVFIIASFFLFFFNKKSGKIIDLTKKNSQKHLKRFRNH